jgi:hypothetical protein
LTDTELAYLAGIIDGEGYVQIARYSTGTYGPRLTVGNTSRALIDYLHVKYGGKVYTVNPKHQRGNAKPAWTWFLGGTAMVKLLAEVEPFLLVKRAQARAVLDVSRFHALGKPRKNSWTPNELQHAAVAHTTLLRLNHRGIQPKPHPLGAK